MTDHFICLKAESCLESGINCTHCFPHPDCPTPTVSEKYAELLHGFRRGEPFSPPPCPPCVIIGVVSIDEEEQPLP